MRHKHFISAMTEYWALMPDRSHAYLELVVKHFGTPDVMNIERPKDFTSAFISMSAKPYFISEFGQAAPVSEAPEGSIAVIMFSDVITKYDGFCNAGVDTKAALFAEVQRNPNIIGSIIVFDTPGGEARAPEKMGQLMKQATKPVFAYVDNLCASAGYWMAAHADKIYASGKVAQIGSVGAFTTIVDQSKRLKQLGYNLIEIYAKQSTLKNIEFREALAGKPEKMQQRITELQSMFESAVRDNRNDLIVDETVYQGALMFADRAVEAGLIDGIASFDEVVAMVEAEAKRLDLINTTTYY